MGSAREAARSEDEVGDGEESPDGGEEHKVYAVRRPRTPGAGMDVDNVGRQTEDDEREEGLHRSQREDGYFEESHCVCECGVFVVGGVLCCVEHKEKQMVAVTITSPREALRYCFSEV